MKFIIVVLLVAKVINTNSVEQSSFVTLEDLKDSRIINGVIASPGQFPWQVLIKYWKGKYDAYCGGALICENWVLTAAQCVKGGSRFTVYLGSVNTSQATEPGRVILNSRNVIYNNYFNPSNLKNDIGLIQLRKSVKYTDQIKPIALDKGYIYGDVPVHISGWGSTSDDNPGRSDSLRYTMLQTMTNKQCKQYYPSWLVRDEILCCAGFNKRNTCFGDNGGALVAQSKTGQTIHVGIASFGSPQGCQLGLPSGYTRTGNYFNWIKERVDRSCKLIHLE